MNPSAASWSHLSLVLRVISSTIPKIWWNSELPSAVESPDVVVPDHTRPAVPLSHRVDLEAGLKINDLEGSVLSSYSVFYHLSLLLVSRVVVSWKRRGVAGEGLVREAAVLGRSYDEFIDHQKPFRRGVCDDTFALVQGPAPSPPLDPLLHFPAPPAQGLV